MDTRRSAALRSVTATLVAVSLGLTAPAIANTPSTASGVTLGVTYFGTLDTNCTGEACASEFWRLPTLRAQDHITVAWTTPDGDNPGMCLTGNVDDFSYAQNLCTLGDAYLYSDASGRRDVITVQRAATSAFLTFGTFQYDRGSYQFVVERIQSKIGVSLPSKFSVKRAGLLRARPVHTDGSPIPDGTTFSLYIKFKTFDPDKLVKRSAAVSDGVLKFGLGLPRKFSGLRGSFQIYRSADGAYQTTKSPKRSIVVQ